MRVSIHSVMKLVPSAIPSTFTREARGIRNTWSIYCDNNRCPIWKSITIHIDTSTLYSCCDLHTIQNRFINLLLFNSFYRQTHRFLSGHRLFFLTCKIFKWLCLHNAVCVKSSWIVPSLHITFLIHFVFKTWKSQPLIKRCNYAELK